MPIPLEEQNIIRLLGIESLPDERKIALVEKITDLVQKRLLLRLLESMSEELRVEFEQLLDQADQPALQAFLQKNAPDFGAWVNEEVLKVKQELQGLVTS